MLFHNPFCRRLILFLGGVLMLLFSSTEARCDVLNWNTYAGTGWTAGTPNTTGVSQTFGAITVNLKDSSAATTWTSGAGGFATTPSIGNSLMTDGLTGQNALQLGIQSTPSTSATVTVTVTFAQPVSNVSFTLWDVDRAVDGQQGNNTGNSYTDLISNIGAKVVGGATVVPTTIVNGGSSGTDNVTVNSTTVSGTQVTGGSPGGGTENDNINSGQVVISFTNTQITSFSFQWSNPGWINGDTSIQFIALGNINFTPTPEVQPGMAALVLCAGCVFWGGIRARRRRREAMSTCS